MAFSPNWSTGYVPPNTEWNSLWANKADVSTNTTSIFTTIATLEAATSATLTGGLVFVEGYYAPADGGAGFFILGSTTTANGGTIINDASGRSWYRQSGAQSYSWRWFGAKGDGTTNDAAAIQAAINAASLAGATARAPDNDNYHITSTLTIGNGTVSAVSTQAGVILGGPTIPANGFWYAVPPCATLTWGGGAAPMIKVNGPLQGWGVQNLVLNGNGVATGGISVTSGSFGDNSNLFVTGCVVAGIYSTTVPTFAGATNADSIHNSWRNITVTVPAVANAIAVLLTGEPAGSSNTDYNTFYNLLVGLPSALLTYGIYLQNCDSNQFWGVHLAGGGASTIGVEFDYTSVAGEIWPSANSFFGIDSNGAVLGANQYANTGTPSVNARPNYIYGLNEDNSATNPNLANLVPSRPSVYSPNVFLINQTTSISGTGISTPFVAGLYRISLYLGLTNLGNNVTVLAAIGWNDGSARTLATSAINFSTGSNNPQTLTATVFNVANLGFTYSTTVSGAVGSGSYQLAIVVERMS